MDAWQAQNISSRIHWATFPGADGEHANDWNTFRVTDGPPAIKLNSGELIDL